MPNYLLLISLLMSISIYSQAELKAIDDTNLSNITGQAFFSVDKTVNPTDTNINYTRINMGLDIDIQTNIDKVELGKYARIDSQTGQQEAQGSDILIDDLSLGYIYNEQYQRDNPNLPRPKDANGNAYSNGDIVPFKIKDPFVEFAFEGEQVVGARIGFGGAQGLLSGTIRSLTGNVDVDVSGTVKNLRDALRRQGFGGWCGFSCTMADHIVNLGGILNSTKLETTANLIHDSGSSKGNYDPARATSIGVLNGEKFTLDILGGIDLKANGCSLLGINVCFPLDSFNSLPIGKRDSNGNISGVAKGMFLSFQTKNIAWKKDVKGANQASNYMNTIKGAFMNIPSGGIKVDFLQSLNGIPRARTEYINRGKGLF